MIPGPGPLNLDDPGLNKLAGFFLALLFLSYVGAGLYFIVNWVVKKWKDRS